MKNLFGICIFLILAMPVFAHEENGEVVLNATIKKNHIHGDVAVYNLSNGKLHTADCEWAEKCTKNCIFIRKKDVKKMFYIPCLVCGGGVIEPIAENDEQEFSKTDF